MYNEREIGIIGHAGSDADVRAAGNSNVLTVNVAATKSWLGKNDEWQHQTVWFKCKMWNSKREILEQVASRFGKGDLVRVTGLPEAPEAWADREGKPVATNVITANAIKFIAKASKGQDIGEEERLTEQEGELPF